MSRDDPRLVRLSILVARTVHAAGCRWSETGAQRCTCGLHALAQDVRDYLAHAITVAEVDGLRADAAERDLAACRADGARLSTRVADLDAALSLAHADRDHALAAAVEAERRCAQLARTLAERERLAAGLRGDAGVLAQVRAMAVDDCAATAESRSLAETITTERRGAAEVGR